MRTMIERAREPEQKAQRREAILVAAQSMWEEGIAFADFTMAELARRASLAKGTLYLYFQTKEDVFLALLERDVEVWFAYLIGRMERLRASMTADRFAGILCDSLAEREHFTRLFVLLESVLEQNIDPERARAFKLGLDAALRQLSAAVSSAFEGAIDAHAAYDLLLHSRALMCGLWVMATPSPVIATLMQTEASLHRLRLDFLPALRRGVRALALGFLQE